MKKIIVSLLMLLIFSLFSACNSDDEIVTVKNGTYVLEQSETEAEVSPYVTISDDDISFSYDLLSSYWPHGTYTIEEDILTMTTDDKMFKYVFRLDGDTLIFQKNESSPVKLIDSRLGVEVTDNAEFKYKAKENEKSSNTTVSTKDEMFELKMYLDKDTYTNNEIVNCYATLEYIGEEDNIVVYSSDPLVGFSLKDDKYFDGGYTVNDILMATTFEKGKIVRFDYVKSGGWTEDDPNADFYEKFFSEKELILPAGTYEISASIACSLNENDILGSQYKNSVSSYITVTK